MFCSHLPHPSRIVGILAFCAVVSAVAPDSPISPSSFADVNGFHSSKDWLPRTPVITSLTGEQLVDDAAVPVSFDWRNHNGRSFVTTDLMQHTPKYCGACWILGTVATLNDRIKLQRRAQFPDTLLSRQMLINCVPQYKKHGIRPPNGCGGGDAWMILQYMEQNRVPDETCLPYLAENMQCEPYNVCRNCAPKLLPNGSVTAGTCFPVKSWAGYKVSQYGTISGELAMQKEIYARGPISCSIAVAINNASFVFNYTTNEGVLKDNVYTTATKTTKDDIDHVVEVAGWGETASGTKYWVIRNSWGTFWGDMGWFKIRRGINQQQIESDCQWAVVDVGEVEKELAGQVLGDYYSGITVLSKPGSEKEKVGSEHAGPVLGDFFAAKADAAILGNSHGTWITTILTLAVGCAAGSLMTRILMMRRTEPRSQELLG